MIIIEPISITDSVLLSTSVVDNEYPAFDLSGWYAPGDRVIVPSERTVYQQIRGQSATVVISTGNPTWINWAGHGLVNGMGVRLRTSGALPAGFAINTTYYVTYSEAARFQLSATPGGSSIVASGVQSGTHTVVINEPGMTPATSPLYWKKVGASNARKMFDDQNNTQTTNADSIVVSLKPSMICTGVYLGGLDASSVTVEVVDPAEGLVYQRTESLVQSNSRSSFWNWYFQRIVRRNVFVALDLPPYLNATITIRINNPGGLAKCGMCCIGTLLDMGLTFYGVATDIKDWSSTKFEVDGTSSTIERGYSKRMTLEVQLENDKIDSVQDALAAYRQTRVVWIAIKASRWTVMFGKYSSFKNVIQNFAFSRMALTIEATI